MTKVMFTELNSGILFECRGHAGDRNVCAGVSALCIALAEKLRELDDERAAKINSMAVAGGEVAIEAEWDDTYGEAIVKTVFDTVRKGFERIEEMYPENLRCETA